MPGSEPWLREPRLVLMLAALSTPPETWMKLELEELLASVTMPPVKLATPAATCRPPVLFLTKEEAEALSVPPLTRILAVEPEPRLAAAVVKLAPGSRLSRPAFTVVSPA